MSSVFQHQSSRTSTRERAFRPRNWTSGIGFPELDFWYLKNWTSGIEAPLPPGQGVFKTPNACQFLSPGLATFLAADLIQDLVFEPGHLAAFNRFAYVLECYQAIEYQTFKYT